MEVSCRIALLVAISLSFSSGYVKKWTKFSNWNNGQNWDKQRIPCSSDVAVLPSGVVVLDDRAAILALELLGSSEIAMVEGNGMTFGSTAGDGCPGGLITFTASNRSDLWLNPFNWDVIENGTRSAHSDAILYVDRAPCAHDRVNFPPFDAFFAAVTLPAQVSALHLNEANITDSQAQAYFSTEVGRRRFSFSPNASLTVNNAGCSSPFGCQCVVNQKVKDAICGAFSCPADCGEESVAPEGDCCRRCGSLIKMNASPGFDLHQCEAELRSRIATEPTTTDSMVGVQLALSPLATSSGPRVQIVLADTSGGLLSRVQGKKIYQYLLKPPNGTKCLGDNIEIHPNEALTTAETSSNNTTTIIALFSSIAFAVLILILVLVIYCCIRKRSSFEVKNERFHDEMSTTGVEGVELSATSHHDSINAFDNPVYDSMSGSFPRGASSGLMGKFVYNPDLTLSLTDLKTRRTPLDKNMLANQTNVEDAGFQDSTSEPGYYNPLYDVRYSEEEKKPPIDDEDLQSEDPIYDSPHWLKAELKKLAEEEEEEEDGSDDGSLGEQQEEKKPESP